MVSNAEVAIPLGAEDNAVDVRVNDTTILL